MSIKVYATHVYYRDGVEIARVKNLVTTEGLNDILTKYFKGSAYTSTPFVGIINNTGYIAIVAGDTAAKITTSSPGGGNNGWEEFTSYTAGTRPALTLGTAVLGAIDNSASLASYTLSANLSLKGSFLVTNSTKGGTTGVLVSEAVLGSPLAYLSGQVISVGIFLSASST
jgi:hypothetical protein